MTDVSLSDIGTVPFEQGEGAQHGLADAFGVNHDGGLRLAVHVSGGDQDLLLARRDLLAARAKLPDDPGAYVRLFHALGELAVYHVLDLRDRHRRDFRRVKLVAVEPGRRDNVHAELHAQAPQRRRLPPEPDGRRIDHRRYSRTLGPPQLIDGVGVAFEDLVADGPLRL